MRREICGSCHSTNLHEVLDLGDSPLADDFPHTAVDAITQPRYPLGLARCHRCTLLQLTEVVDDGVLWGGDYGFYTGSSWVAVQAQQAYAQDLMRRYPNQARGLVVEVACNDGSMLSEFARAGCKTLCVDPAEGPTTKAKESGLDVVVELFGSEVARRVVSEHGRASLVVANNVIAHVTDLDDFVAGLAILLKPTGRLVVEFQYAADLVTGNMIDHVYHEHRFFFSLTSLSYSLQRHGLKALHVQQTVPQGGSLRVHIGQAVQNEEPDMTVMDLLASEVWLGDPASVAGFQGRANRIRSRLLDKLYEQRTAGLRVAGYGASAKSTTLLNFCDLSTDLIQYFVDTTPMKHGRFTPGTGIPIIDPRSDSRAPDCYLLTVHNYAGPIMRKENFAGQWLVPIPLPVML